MLKRRDEVEEIYRSIVGHVGEFTEESWRTFLSDTQQVSALTPLFSAFEFSTYLVARIRSPRKRTWYRVVSSSMLIEKQSECAWTASHRI